MTERPTNVKVRLARDLHHWLKVQAAINRRTLEREVEFHLDQAKRQLEGGKQ